MNRSRRFTLGAAALSAMLAGVYPAPASAQSPAESAPAAVEPAQGLKWPRVIQNAAETLTVYQPQIEEWNGMQILTRAAVAVQPVEAPAGGSQPTYGVVWMTARADVDKSARVVTFQDFKIAKVSFPTTPEKEAQYKELLAKLLPTDIKTVALDHLEASLAVSEAVKKQQALEVRNTPPRILYSTTPTILMLVDGPPALRPMTGMESVERVLNTRALIVKMQGRFYLSALNFWYQAPAIEGPWKPDDNPPPILNMAREAASAAKLVDLMQVEPNAPQAATPPARPPEAPAVRVSTVPAELIQTDGPLKMLPVEDTNLFQVQNSDDAIFMNLQDNLYYVLLSGRWFRSASLYGPAWEFVPARTLPEDFAKIPPDHPRANALVSVPGTPQAREALIANSIPQTATVNRAAAKLDAAYDGAPQFAPIQGTALQYAVNCPLPVIRVGADSFYCVQNGVWFTAGSPMGPWAAATSVPPEIYSIPASSPLHYVTYVYVYGATPEVVYSGYTPGYLGTCVSTDGTVVYGTGYAYSAWCGGLWVGYPWTYGFSAGFACDSRYGFGFGFAVSPFFPGCCPRPWWGPFAWAREHQIRYNHVRLDHVNIYRHWDARVVPIQHRFEGNHWAGKGWSDAREPFNPYSARTVTRGEPHWEANAQRRTERGAQALPFPAFRPPESPAMRALEAPFVRSAAPPARAPESPATGHITRTQPNSVFAGKSGEVFRATPDRGWEQYTRKGWQNAGESPAFRQQSPALNSERKARDIGAQRFDAWQSGGGFAPGSGPGSGGHGGPRGR